VNAPKRIWVWEYAAEQLVNENPDSTDVKYIRSDLVDGLVEALNECLKVEGYKNARDMIEVALKKLEEE